MATSGMIIAIMSSDMSFFSESSKEAVERRKIRNFNPMRAETRKLSIRPVLNERMPIAADYRTQIKKTGLGVQAPVLSEGVDLGCRATRSA